MTAVLNSQLIMQASRQPRGDSIADIINMRLALEQSESAWTDAAEVEFVKKRASMMRGLSRSLPAVVSCIYAVAINGKMYVWMWQRINCSINITNCRWMA